MGIFHYSCVGIKLDALPDAWIFSESCRSREPFYRIFHCHEDKGVDEPVIGCNAEKRCEGTELYHMKCVGINVDEPPEEDWFCQEACMRH